MSNLQTNPLSHHIIGFLYAFPRFELSIHFFMLRCVGLISTEKYIVYPFLNLQTTRGDNFSPLVRLSTVHQSLYSTTLERPSVF